jgi:hypothetical protein
LRAGAPADVEIPGFEDADADDDAPEKAAPDAAETIGDTDDTLTIARKLLKDAQRGAKSDRGDPQVSARWIKIASELTNLIARIQKNTSDTTNTLHIPVSDVEKTWKELMAKVRVVCSRPLVCEHCGKKMMVALAAGTDEP